MKTFRLFCNNNKKSNEIAAKLREFFIKDGNFVESPDAEYCVAVGGDGCFLRMVRECKFNKACKFIGVNTGTLGFLQEVKPEDIELLVKCLAEGTFKEQELSVLNCEVAYGNKIKKVTCLNEVVVREQNLKTLFLDINVDGDKLETFSGEGMLISTSVGSTAYNLSFGGSIVSNKFHTLQLTPIAPLNTIAYRSLTTSVIMPEDANISLIPKNSTNNLIFTADGNNFILKEAKALNIRLRKEKICHIKIDGYSFYNKINEKILGGAANV